MWATDDNKANSQLEPERGPVQKMKRWSFAWGFGKKPGPVDCRKSQRHDPDRQWLYNM